MFAPGVAYGVLDILALAIRSRGHPDVQTLRFHAFYWFAVVGAFFFALLAFGVARQVTSQGVRLSRRRWVIAWATALTGAGWLVLMRAVQLGRFPEESVLIAAYAAVFAVVLRFTRLTQVESQGD